MNFYLSIARKYANIRTFNPEGLSGAGGDDASGDDAPNDDSKSDDAGEKAADAGDDQTKTADDQTKTADDLAKKYAALEAEKAELLKETMKRKAELKEARDALSAFKGVDPKRVEELMKREEEAAKAEAEARGDFERVKQMMADEHKRDKEELQAKTATLETALSEKDRQIEELTVGNAFGMSEYIKDSLVLSPSKTRVLYGSHFEVKDGRVVAFDKPSGAKDRTMLVNSAGEPLPFEEALERIVSADPDKNSVLRSRARSGAGSATSTQAPGKSKQNDGQPERFGVSRIAAVIGDL